MQLSQLFRRGIVVPLTDRTEEQFSRWFVDDFATVAFLPIADESLFEDIFKAGVFHLLNEVCSTTIDDYEEEALPATTLERGITALAARQKELTEQRNVGLFVESLIMILRLALENHRPVYFVF
ncbi:MAG: hypothetical protein U1E05_05570 [Patescibacteria group bacterium]|nr:hypothetical protein [Patescibacteria group bacterium]